MRKLFLRVVEQTEIVWIDTKVYIPVVTLVDPVVVPLLVFTWLDEEFHFHLLELAGAEDKVSRSDFVAETFSHLADAEWRLHSGSVQHVVEVDENTLSGFRP